MVEIELRRVTKRFGDVTAVDHVDLLVREGDFMAIVGPTGCGKTTLLRLIAGLASPDEGAIHFDGRLVNDLSPAQRNVAMVFQGYALWPHMKVLDEKTYSNISFAMKIRQYLAEEIRKRAGAVATKVGIGKELFRRMPDELSEGQKQKVALGRAITVRRDVLLLDEPLSNLDPPTRVRVGREIRELHEDLGITTIYVTHNLVEAMALADRVAVMKEGAIQQVGTPEEVYEHPDNEFVSNFIKYYDLQRTPKRWAAAGDKVQ